MFPSLVNCCTIDWLNPWPKDALFSVAEMFLEAVAAEEMPQKSLTRNDPIEDE